MAKPFNGKRFTKAEKLLVLKEALRLIRKPENWVKGAWKCEVTTAVTGGGKYCMAGIRGRDPVTGKRVTAQLKRDSRGRQLYAYCLEGAINQAALNVLGFEKANQLGFVYGTPENPDVTNTESANNISVLTFINEMYPPDSMYMYSWKEINGFNDSKTTTHKQIVDVLKAKIKSLKDEIAKRTK